MLMCHFSMIPKVKYRNILQRIFKTDMLSIININLTDNFQIFNDIEKYIINVVRYNR